MKGGCEKMDFKNKVKELLEQPICTIERYSYVIGEIERRMNENAGNDDKAIKMRSFYRGDKQTAALCPKLFLDKSCFKVENITFIDRYESRNDKTKNEFHFLCNSQHQGRCTRLLDFSTDPLVALRFACGNDDNCNKRITIFYTNSIKRDEKDFEDEDINALMKLVMSVDLKNFTEDEKRRVSKDYFIDCPTFLQDIKRCKRQKGAFLFPGNLENINKAYCGDKKVIHKLSEKYGRGNEYPGYIVNIPIKKEYVRNIRDELENIPKYSEYQIDYLMCKK